MKLIKILNREGDDITREFNTEEFIDFWFGSNAPLPTIKEFCNNLMITFLPVGLELWWANPNKSH